MTFMDRNTKATGVAIAIIVVALLSVAIIGNGGDDRGAGVSEGLVFEVTGDGTAKFVGLDGYTGDADVLEIPSKVSIDGKTYVVTSIGSMALGRDSGFETVILPDTLTAVDAAAFGYSSIREITLPGSVVYIGQMAFMDCTELESVVFEGPVQKIGGSPFIRCPNLNEVGFTGGGNYFSRDGLVVDVEAHLVFVMSSLDGHLDLPYVEWIDSGAFGGSHVSSVNLPSSLLGLGTNPFGFSELESVTVDADNAAFASEDGILFSKDMSQIVYYPCKKTGLYVISENVTSIHSNAFTGTELTGITIGSNVTDIGIGAFGSLGFVTSPDKGQYLSYDELPGYSYVRIDDRTMLRI